MIEIPTDEMLFAGVGRTISAFDRRSGRPVWRIKLPRFFGGSLTMIAAGNELYVGRGAYVYCIDARRGEVVWERGLGSSSSLVFLALSGNAGTFAEQHASATAMIQQQQAAAAGAAAASAAAASS